MTAHRLLVIEDDKDIADLVCLTAEELGFETRAVCDISQLAAVYAQFPPNVIVLDIIMPEMDGFEVLSFLHTQQSRSRIVILSGQGEYRTMASHMGEGLALNVVGNIAKPFRLADLRKVLEQTSTSLADTAADAAA
jgi:CheY-like chemotaxis protein